MRVLGLATVVGLLVAVAALALPPYFQYFAGRLALLMIVALSLNLLMGAAGLLSLASAAFMGIGAYGVIILMTDWGLPLLVAAPAAIVIAWVLGWILGSASLRLSGFYLALVTLGFLLTFQVILRSGGDVTGGGYGLVAPEPELVGLSIPSEGWSFASLFLVAFITVLVYSLLGTKTGRAWRALKANEVAASMVGVNLMRLKTSTFALSAAMAALAGVFFAFLQGATNPQAFGVAATVEHLVYIVVGGMGSVAGSLIGPLVLEVAPELMRGLEERRELFFGATVLAILIIAPRGVAGSLGSVARYVETRMRTVIRREAVVQREAVSAVPVLWDEDGIVNGARAAGVEFDDLRVRFGGLVAVDGLSFTVAPGELHGLIGPNGAGKTTAINALTGFAPVDRGEIRVDGRVIRSASGGVASHLLSRNGIARTFQTPVVVADLTPVQNVMLGAHDRLRAGMIRGALRLPSAVREDAAAVDEARYLLDQLSFTGKHHSVSSSLGFADLRKIEMARALAQRPRLLLLDEPTSGLELGTAAAIVEFLIQLKSQRGTEFTIVLVEHNVRLVFGYCDSVTAMEAGREVVTGPPSVVRSNERVREAYLGPQIVEEFDHVER